MMAGNPNWWSMNGMHPQLSSQFVYGGPNPSPPPPPPPPHPNHDFPVRSWSQLLLGGIGGGEEEEEEEERFGGGLFQQQKKVENWEEQVLNSNFSRIIPSSSSSSDHRVKQESSAIPYPHLEHELIQTSWPRQHHHHPPPPPSIPVSSPTSSVTTLNFSGTAKSSGYRKNHHHNHDHSSECNSGGVSKKARVQQSSAQPALKVRKEKLGERITSLHQIVSPFGKTDTASVLSEAIGYIRFLQSQIEALSSPYMRNAAAVHHQHSVQERNCLFPEEPSQFLNDIAMDGRGVSKQDSQGRSGMKDLRSRGLCLVPISCTQHVGNETGADYWALAAFGGGF